MSTNPDRIKAAVRKLRREAIRDAKECVSI